MNPSWGMANVSLDRSTIIWNLGSARLKLILVEVTILKCCGIFYLLVGNRFPSKTLETSLKAMILFVDEQDQSNRTTSLNYYAQVCKFVN